MGAAAERGLFAAKGRATPGGVPLNDTAPVPQAPASPRQAALPLPGAGGEAAAAEGHADPRPDSHPAGSLLTFRLRGEPSHTALSEALRAALIPPAEIEPAPAPAATAADVAASEAASAEPLSDGSAPAAPMPQIPAVPAAERPASARLDRPLFPRSSSAAQRAAAIDATPPSVALPHVLPSASVWRTVLPIGAAVTAIAVVGWLMAQAGPERAGPERAGPEQTGPEQAGTAASAPIASSAEPAPETATAPAAPDETAALPTPVPLPPANEAPVAGDGAVSDAPAPQPAAALPAEPAAAPAAISEAGVPDFAAADSASVGTAEPLPTVVAVAPFDAPTFEIVRVEPGAPPVLAGRAAPGSQLIVLDNGEPIGTVTADGNGEWALVSAVPLPVGRHELSLALKTADGTVVVEQADTEAEAAPADAATSPDGLPLPAQKPAAGATSERSYVIQLASVPSAADAAREWTRLQKAHPDLLGSRAADIDAAEIGDRGTFYRVRTGPFSDRDAARTLCRALNNAGQECLVVREAAAN